MKTSMNNSNILKQYSNKLYHKTSSIL